MKYTSKELIHITNIGDILIITADRDMKREELVGTTINIDGLDILVRGVESFAKNMINEGDSIGILK